MPTPAIVRPTDDVDFVTVASIFNEMAKPTATLDAHMLGTVTGPPGATRHNDTHVDMTGLPESTAPSQAPATQHAYNDGTYRALSNWLGSYAGSGFIAKVASAAADMTVPVIVSQLRNHSHASPTLGGQLAQANTHLTPDTDSAPTALHHTLGLGANQAAAGNHVHTGPQTYTGTAGNAALALRNAPTDPGQFIFAVSNNAGNANFLTVQPNLVNVTGALTASGQVSATAGFVGALTGNATGVTAGAITNAMLAASVIDSSKIIDGAIATNDIAANAITTPLIASGAVTGAQIANGAVGAPQIANGAVGSAQIAANAVTSALIAAGAVGTPQIANGAVTTPLIANAAVGTAQLVDASVTGAKLAAGVFTTDKIAEGAVTAQSPASQMVNVAAITRFSADGVMRTYTGGSVDLSPLIAAMTVGQNRYCLIAINGVGNAYAVPGAPVTGALSDANRPTAGVDTAPLAFVQLRYGLPTSPVNQGDITPAREIYSFYGGGGGAGGSVVGHQHGRTSGESYVESVGLQEGRAHPTTTMSKSIVIEALRYANTAGLVTQLGQSTVGPVPDVTSLSIFPVSLLRATGQYVIGTPTSGPGPVLPALPSFNLTQSIPIAYVVNRPGSAYIRGYGDDDLTNGYLLDARVWVAAGGTGGPGSGAAVGDGGTGQTGFAQGLIWQASPSVPTTPLATIPATTGPLVGLGVQPTVAGMSGGATVDVLALGGGVGGANVGAVATQRINGTHILTPPKTGAGVATEIVALLVDAGAGGTNNAAAVFAGNVRVGGPTVPASTNALDVTGNAAVSGTLAVSGTTALTGAVAATGAITSAASIATTGASTGLITASNGLRATAGGLTVSAGGASITGATNVGGALTVSNGVNVQAGGAAIAGASSVNGNLTTTGIVIASGNGNGVQVMERTVGTHSTLLYRTGNTVWFYDDLNGNIFGWDSTTGISTQIGSWTTFPTNWVSGSPAMAYRKEYPSGRVTLRGGITNSTNQPYGTILVIIPVGFRPSVLPALFSCVGYVGAGYVAATVNIDASGNMLVQTIGGNQVSPNGAQLWFDGVSWPTV